jgi:hypothetical protein
VRAAACSAATSREVAQERDESCRHDDVAMLAFRAATAEYGVLFPSCEVGRIDQPAVQGLATGGAIGAIGAGMLDVDQTRGAVANATAPGLGAASGALLSSFAVQWLPAPTQLVYIVLAGVLVAQAFGVVLLPETSPKALGAWRSLVPQIAIPAQTRRPLLAAAPVLFAVWALAGFYGSLGPALIDHLVRSASVIGAGLNSRG